MQSNRKEPKISQSRKDDKTKTSVFISSNLGFTTSGHTDRFEQYLVHQIINAIIISFPSVLAQKSFFFRWFPNNEHRYIDARKTPRERPFL